MPVRRTLNLLGVVFLLFFISGCQPTSESSGISALSLRYDTMETPAGLDPTALPSQVPAISATPSGAQISPTPLPSPTSAGCQEIQGEMIRQQMDSEYVKTPLQVRIYLPPCFSASRAEPYPLLVLLHGSVFTDEQWDRLGIDETADRLISEGTIPPLLIVMPYEEQTLANPYQAGFGSALSTELLPWLEAEFPLCRERSCRAIGGISRGASWAVHIGFNSWRLFGSIGAHSLPPFWGDLSTLPIWLSDIPREERPRVFIDVGQSDPYRQPAAQFEQFLTDNHLPHEWYLFTGGHDETYWASHVEQYLLWYSEAWQD